MNVIEKIVTCFLFPLGISWWLSFCDSSSMIMLYRKLFQLREGDTGSSAVQVVALTTRIQQLQTHMAKHNKDTSTKRGLDALFVRRRKVLDYMERKQFESYRKVVKSLGLVR